MHIDADDYNESDGVACPWEGCDKESESVMGMKIHHAQSHGVSIAGELVKCDWCGETRREKATRARNQEHHFCHSPEGAETSECHNNWMSEQFSGEGSPNWKGGKATVHCDWCGDPKLVDQNALEQDHHFCSPTEEDNVHSDCYRSWISENNTGEDSPVWSGRVEVTCAWCEEPKEVPPHELPYRDRFFCDRDCSAKWMSKNLAGENSPSWSGGLVDVDCAWCGESKSIIPAQDRRSKNHFCDTKCMGAWQSENYDEGGNPAWIDRVSVECAWCGATREVHPTHAKKCERHFCLEGGYDHSDCLKNWISENRSGENHPCWNGGFREWYGPNWPEQREKRIQMDNEQCIKCGLGRDSHYEVHGRDLSVHHIIRKEDFRRNDGTLDYESANDTSNLLTLCDAHHSDYEGVPIDTRHLSTAGD